MRESFLPFTRPSIGDAEVSAVRETLLSGWITGGPRTAEFEERFSTSVGATHAVAVSSATAGFHLLFKALGIGPGDEIVTPSLTWPSAVNAVEHVGARAVFADVDSATLQLDEASVRACVTESTRAIVPVHFAGQPVDLDAFRALAAEIGAVLIEDAAHAVGTEFRGSPVGGGESLAVFSFHAIKNLTTGEGGMITTDDAALADELRRLRFHGLDQDAWTRHGGEPGTYDLVEPSGKFVLTDLQASLGLAQLERLPSLLEARAAFAARYDGGLVDLSGLRLPRRVGYDAKHSWHLYAVLVTRGDRAAFRKELRNRNIGTGLHFLPVHGLSYYRQRYPDAARRLQQTNRVGEQIVSLPLFPDMTERDVDDVIAAVRSVLGE